VWWLEWGLEPEMELPFWPFSPYISSGFAFLIPILSPKD
jgi:hypothetical protein